MTTERQIDQQWVEDQRERNLRAGRDEGYGITATERYDMRRQGVRNSCLPERPASRARGNRWLLLATCFLLGVLCSVGMALVAEVVAA